MNDDVKRRFNVASTMKFIIQEENRARSSQGNIRKVSFVDTNVEKQ